MGLGSNFGPKSGNKNVTTYNQLIIIHATFGDRSNRFFLDSGVLAIFRLMYNSNVSKILAISVRYFETFSTLVKHFVQTPSAFPGMSVTSCMIFFFFFCQSEFKFGKFLQRHFSVTSKENPQRQQIFLKL